jgi:hypothetical protein
MGCEFSHTPSHMSYIIGFGNTQQQIRRLYTKIIISGMWVGLIPMNNSPLDPLSLVESYLLIIIHPFHIATSDYYFY